MKFFILFISMTIFSFGLGAAMTTFSFDLSAKDYNEKEIISELSQVNPEYPMYEIGTGFISGKILHVDYKKALFWLEKSSMFENSNKASFLVGDIYSKGLLNIKEIDINKSIVYYKRASMYGNKDASLKIAINYLYNINILDVEKGLNWLKESIKNKNMEALQIYSALLLNKTDNKTILKQINLIELRSLNGDKLSSLFLGILHMRNFIVKRDLDKSKVYFFAAMNQGSLVAEDFLIQLDKIQLLKKRENNEEFHK